ncbi:MAG: MarR family transcriptional regulator, partial [Gammaproteobacteria bacterium]|nr:MarR family transcriptional regulator [Gammaproteobacteria bacterium]
FDAGSYRSAGSDLTVPQADVIFTLGNTGGMTCGEIGERTLITKGTLTGVIDRLAAKGLVKRVTEPSDKRRTRIVLTAAGEKTFQAEFPRQIKALKERFDLLSKTDKQQLTRLLKKLREIF